MHFKDEKIPQYTFSLLVDYWIRLSAVYFCNQNNPEYFSFECLVVFLIISLSICTQNCRCKNVLAKFSSI